MINNGGGLFDEQKQPNCVTPENIEAVNFVLEMVSKGYVDPASATYTSANVQTQWKAKKFGLGYDTGGLADNLGGDVAKDIAVISPLTSPSGKKGALYFPNNIMMYKNNPSIKGTEAFLTYYYQNMAPLWTQNTGIGLPPLKSISQDQGVPSRQEQGADHRGVAAHCQDVGRPGRGGQLPECDDGRRDPGDERLHPVDPRRENRRQVGLDEASG